MQDIKHVKGAGSAQRKMHGSFFGTGAHIRVSTLCNSCHCSVSLPVITAKLKVLAVTARRVCS